MDGKTERESAVLFLRGIADAMRVRGADATEHTAHAMHVARATLEAVADSIERGHHIIAREGWRERVQGNTSAPPLADHTEAE